MGALTGGRRGGKQAALDVETLRAMVEAYIGTATRVVGLSDFLKLKTGWTWRRLDRALEELMRARDLLDEHGFLKTGWEFGWKEWEVRHGGDKGR